MFYIYFFVSPISEVQYVSKDPGPAGGRRSASEGSAAYLQCTQVCYSYYESGKRDIPTDVLIRLAKLYQVSTDYLLGLTDQRQPYPAGKSRT